MTQIRGTALPADLARVDASNVWSGTQDFSGATVLGIAGGGSGGGTVAGATSTAAGVVQLAGDLAGTYQAPTVAKLNGATPAAVATSGAYADLTGRPALAPVATSGVYADLTGRPALAPVATSGVYTDLTGRPALAPVATSGAYGDLTGAPTVPTLYLRGKAAATTTTSTTAAADADLVIPSVPVGTYAFEVYLATAPGAAAVAYVTFQGTAGTAGTFAGTWNNGGTAGSSSLGGGFNLATASRLTATGELIVTAAGSFGVYVASATNGSATGFGQGSWLRLTKVA